MRAGADGTATDPDAVRVASAVDDAFGRTSVT